MNDSDISTHEQAEAALAQQTLERHKKLWLRAEGRATWAYVLGIVAAVALVGTGLSDNIADIENRLIYVALGLVVFFQVQFIRSQSQSAAIRRLIERLEERVTRIEKRRHGDH